MLRNSRDAEVGALARIESRLTVHGELTMSVNGLGHPAILLALCVFAGCAEAPPQVVYPTKHYRGDVPVAIINPNLAAPQPTPRDVPISGPVTTCHPDDLLQVKGEVDLTHAELGFISVNIMHGADADMTVLTGNYATGIPTESAEGRGQYDVLLNAPEKPGKYTVIVLWGDGCVARTSLVVTKPRDAAPQVPR
jgi:hypothetical protein